MDQLANGPDSRRIIVCAWDPRLVEDQALPPCHCFFQFWTRELSLEDRINALQDRHDAEDLLIPSRGQPPVRTVEAFKSRLCVWNNPAIVTEEFMHNRLDQAQAPRRGLSCHLYQRSVDTFLGKPFNITFYSLMTHQLANQFNMAAEEFIWTGGDCHIYNNHQEQTDLQLTREPYDTPRILFQPTSYGKDQREITPDDFVILGYESHPHIAGKVAV
jgi:thymidylate synthase